MFIRLIETSVELHNLIDTRAHFTFSSLVLADPLKIIRLLGLIGASSSGVRGVWRKFRVAQPVSSWKEPPSNNINNELLSIDPSTLSCRTD